MYLTFHFLEADEAERLRVEKEKQERKAQRARARASQRVEDEDVDDADNADNEDDAMEENPVRSFSVFFQYTPKLLCSLPHARFLLGLRQSRPKLLPHATHDSLCPTFPLIVVIGLMMKTIPRSVFY